jgi:tetratricopeptide (TPR) repeat protein
VNGAHLLLWALAIGADPEPAKGFDVSPLHLTVAIVQDPDFPPIEPELAKRALDLAAEEFSRRFAVPKPIFELQNEFTLSGFLGEYALPVDPACKPLYEARYRGGGEAELRERKDAALKFFQKWPLESLIGFVPEAERAGVKTYEDVHAYYVRRYLQTIASMKNLKTPKGTPLVEPERTARRSFVAWTCAFARQKDYDVILTNTFILADLLTEPHPHAVFGKAKVGGIAARSPARTALEGQALLATTFGIDTHLKEFAELPQGPATLEQRAKILGVYLLAHEISHAVFGIPDVFDHPKGCLMTSRPGFTYLDGLKELEENSEPCPLCRPYVEARAAFDRATRAYAERRYEAAIAASLTAAKILPKSFHGSRKKRMSEIIVVASKSYFETGKRDQARSLAQAALDLDPTTEDLASKWRAAATMDASASIKMNDLTTSTVAGNRARSSTSSRSRVQ